MMLRNLLRFALAHAMGWLGGSFGEFLERNYKKYNKKTSTHPLCFVSFDTFFLKILLQGNDILCISMRSHVFGACHPVMSNNASLSIFSKVYFTICGF